LHDEKFLGRESGTNEEGHKTGHNKRDFHGWFSLNATPIIAEKTIQRETGHGTRKGVPAEADAPHFNAVNDCFNS
jgi:hypothetical protein